MAPVVHATELPTLYKYNVSTNLPGSDLGLLHLPSAVFPTPAVEIDEEAVPPDVEDHPWAAAERLWWGIKREDRW